MPSQWLTEPAMLQKSRCCFQSGIPLGIGGPEFWLGLGFKDYWVINYILFLAGMLVQAQGLSTRIIIGY